MNKEHFFNCRANLYNRKHLFAIRSKIETENKKQSNDAISVIENFLDTSIVEPAQKTT